MKVIIAGSRKATKAQVYKGISLAIESCPWAKNITTVISGHARGADTEGEEWAKENNIPVEIYPANWELLGKKAGYVRNEQMAKVCDALIAIWDGSSRGTSHMIDLAWTNYKDVFVYRTDLNKSAELIKRYTVSATVLKEVLPPRLKSPTLVKRI